MAQQYVLSSDEFTALTETKGTVQNVGDEAVELVSGTNEAAGEGITLRPGERMGFNGAVAVRRLGDGDAVVNVVDFKEGGEGGGEGGGGDVPAATPSTAGIAKLYNATGQNTDGAVTQKAATDAVSAVAGDVTTLQGDVTTLQGDVTTLQGQMTTVQGDLTTANGNITALQSDVGTLQTSVGTAQTNIGTLQTDLGTAQGNITTLQSDVGTLQGQMTTANGNISTLQTSLGTAQTDITTLQGQMTTANGNITALQGAQPAARAASTAYALGDLRRASGLPNLWFLECTTAGTSGSGDLTIPSNVADGDTITDGTAVWTAHDPAVVSIPDVLHVVSFDSTTGTLTLSTT